jgi:hypothetical protein
MAARSSLIRQWSQLHATSKNRLRRCANHQAGILAGYGNARLLKFDALVESPTGDAVSLARQSAARDGITSPEALAADVADHPSTSIIAGPSASPSTLVLTAWRSNLPHVSHCRA